jgi:hypothetical protein
MRPSPVLLWVSRSKEHESDQSSRKQHHKAESRQPVEQIILVLAQMVKAQKQDEYGEDTDNSKQATPSSSFEIALVWFWVHMTVLSSTLVAGAFLAAYQAGRYAISISLNSVF